MRYMLFTGYNNYPSGGIHDFHGLYDTLLDLVVDVDIDCVDWFNVYDIDRRVAVPCPDIYGMNREQLREWAVERDRLSLEED